MQNLRILISGQYIERKLKVLCEITTRVVFNVDSSAKYRDDQLNGAEKNREKTGRQQVKNGRLNGIAIEKKNKIERL